MRRLLGRGSEKRQMGVTGAENQEEGSPGGWGQRLEGFFVAVVLS